MLRLFGEMDSITSFRVPFPIRGMQDPSEIELADRRAHQALLDAEMDGVEATKAVRARRSEVAVLVLTTYDTDEAIVRAVEAGAAGYMLKDSPTEDLVDAVRRAAAGETVLSPPITKRLVDRMHNVSPDALTSREIDVLREVANGNTNAEVGERLHISEATVKTHLIHIYDKLGVSDRAAAVARAYEKGILST
jgi:DNA-binding NarL/FixJ family response regulator